MTRYGDNDPEPVLRALEVALRVRFGTGHKREVFCDELLSLLRAGRRETQTGDDNAVSNPHKADALVAPAPLTFAAFAKANRARSESPLGFNHPIDSWSLSDWFTAVTGELGEAANVAKKLNRVRDNIVGNVETESELKVKLWSEIADTFAYLDLLAQSQGFSLEDAVRVAWDAKSAEIGYPHKLGSADRNA